MAEQFKEMTPEDVREQKMRDNMGKAAEKARENSLGPADKKATKPYDMGGKDFGDKNPQSWKTGGMISNVEYAKQTAGGTHHSEHYAKHAGGHKVHNDHIKEFGKK